jgi:hypothetical protein
MSVIHWLGRKFVVLFAAAGLTLAERQLLAT